MSCLTRQSVNDVWRVIRFASNLAGLAIVAFVIWNFDDIAWLLHFSYVLNQIP